MTHRTSNLTVLRHILQAAFGLLLIMAITFSRDDQNNVIAFDYPMMIYAVLALYTAVVCRVVLSLMALRSIILERQDEAEEELDCSDYYDMAEAEVIRRNFGSI